MRCRNLRKRTLTIPCNRPACCVTKPTYTSRPPRSRASLPTFRGSEGFRAQARYGGEVAGSDPRAGETRESFRRESTSGPLLEDWWLVRDSENRVGWVLARMVDLDVPLDIAQYAEGQRIVAFFALNQVQDTGKDGTGKNVSQYLCAITEPHDGLSYDYDQIRVFTWNVKKHRYETAYREHGLNGVLPVTVSSENFEKEGVLPIFILRVKDDSGNISERKYKLNTPIVRRVLAPGEQNQVQPATKRRVASWQAV